MDENTNKVIFHIDMNMFFCSLAVIKHPSLKGKAFACAPSNTTKGVISSASYKAREKGIRSAMSLVEAFRIMPDLICVEPDIKMIHEYHNHFISLIKDYTKIIEVASVDEVYADVSEVCKTRDKIDLAREIQRRLVKEYHLPCSIGIAPTLFLAKMASDMKKPLGLVVINKENSIDILKDLPVSDIFGIGKKTYPILIDNEIQTIKDFIDLKNKEKIIGLIGERTYEYVINSVNGNSRNQVIINKYDKSESLSRSVTFNVYLETIEELDRELKRLVGEVVLNMEKHKYIAKGVTVILRDENFKTKSFSKMIKYTFDYDALYEEAYELLEQNYKGNKIRLLGFGVYGLKDKDLQEEEYNLFTYEKYIEKEEKIRKTLEQLQNKFGKNSITKGIKKP